MEEWTVCDRCLRGVPVSEGVAVDHDCLWYGNVLCPKCYRDTEEGTCAIKEVYNQPV